MRMLTDENHKVYKAWIVFHTVLVCFYFVYFSLYNFSRPFFGGMYTLAYTLPGLVLIACFLVFRRLKDGLELKLLFLYCLWLFAARVIVGDIGREGMKDHLMTHWMFLPYVGFAVLLPREKRQKLLDALLVIYTLAYTVVGIVCVYGIISQSVIMNPFDETTLCEFYRNRLYVFWKSCNAVANWYYMNMGFLTYLFFRSRRKWQRVLTVLGVIVSYLCLASTYSRGSMLSFAVSLGMLAVMLVFEKLKFKPPRYKAAALVVLMCVFIPLGYKSFSVTNQAITSLQNYYSEHRTEELASSQESSEIEAAGENTQAALDVLNSRGLSSSGRTDLWEISIKLLAADPERIMFGDHDAIEHVNKYVKENMPEEYLLLGERLMHHNAYLEVLMQTGVPGFVFMMAFLVLLVVKMIKLYFSQHPNADRSVKTIVITVTGIMLYNCFESALFFIADMRTVIFCILAGYILAFAKDINLKEKNKDIIF